VEFPIFIPDFVASASSFVVFFTFEEGNMPLITWIYRISNGVNDGLLLAAEESKDLQEYIQIAKKLFKTFTRSSPPRQVITAGDKYFIYFIEGSVCYLTLCDGSYPKKLATAYLSEIAKEFDIQYGHEVKSAERPYAFVKFDTFIQKTKQLYLDTKSDRNLEKVTKELNEVQRIMTKNLEDILTRGDKLGTVKTKSERLVYDSHMYHDHAKWLNTGLFWKKWAPVIVVLIIVLFCIYSRFYWFY